MIKKSTLADAFFKSLLKIGVEDLGNHKSWLFKYSADLTNNCVLSVFEYLEGQERSDLEKARSIATGDGGHERSELDNAFGFFNCLRLLLTPVIEMHSNNEKYVLD